MKKGKTGYNMPMSIQYLLIDPPCDLMDCIL